LPQASSVTPNNAKSGSTSASEPPKMQIETISLQTALERFAETMSALDNAMKRTGAGQTLASLGEMHEVRTLIGQVQVIVSQCVTRDECAISVAQRVFKRMYDNEAQLAIEASLAVLEAVRDVCKKMTKELTTWVMYQTDDRRKYHQAITAGFIRSGLVNLNDFDNYLAKGMDFGRNVAAVELASYVARECIINERCITCSELFSMLEQMAKIASRAGGKASPGLMQIVEECRKVQQVGSKEDGGVRNGAGTSTGNTSSASGGGRPGGMMVAGQRVRRSLVFSPISACCLLSTHPCSLY